ncbi:MAG: sigma-70 family RNA polymerase sigma factor [Chloroflexi bacterium]|nr:sigma-70 family RNA polymerase sigma factor [Chloroflexota bacterium]
MVASQVSQLERDGLTRRLVETVRKAAAGDEVAFARLVHEFHPDMVRVAYVVAGDQQLALDAVQAAWTTAWQKLPSLRDPERVRPWLVAVAANAARQLIRREHRHPVAEIRVDPTDDGGDSGRSIERIDLVNALNQLSPNDRALLSMRYLLRLDAPEIAPLVGMSASGVRGRLSRIRDVLRRELRDD